MTAERERRETEVPQTSIAERAVPPGEVAVRFTRWTSWGQTAYQKGQFAGFMRPEAERIVSGGHGQIVDDLVTPRAPVPRASRKFGG